MVAAASSSSGGCSSFLFLTETQHLGAPYWCMSLASRAGYSFPVAFRFSPPPLLGFLTFCKLYQENVWQPFFHIPDSEKLFVSWVILRQMLLLCPLASHRAKQFLFSHKCESAEGMFSAPCMFRKGTCIDQYSRRTLRCLEKEECWLTGKHKAKGMFPSASVWMEGLLQSLG